MRTPAAGGTEACSLRAQRGLIPPFAHPMKNHGGSLVILDSATVTATKGISAT